MALVCVLSGAVGRAVLAERDDGVWALWDTVLRGTEAAFECLCELVSHHVRPTREWFASFAVGTSADSPPWRRGALALIKFRFSYGGIVHDRGGLVKDEQISLLWRPRGLVTRMRHIRSMRERFALRRDALETIQDQAADPAALFFVDPPYTHGANAPGARLYRHHELDHDGIMAALAGVRGRVWVTYNLSEDTLDLGRRHGFQPETMEMRDGRGRTRRELLLTKGV